MNSIVKPFLLLGLILPIFSFAQINPDDITIVRDSFGVPHIYAPTDAGVAYGLAWAHAEDDFPSIFQLITIGKHKQGELLGKEGAKTDFFAQYLKSEERVEQHYTDLPEDYRKLIEGYAAGLSAYAATHPEEVKLNGIFPITGKDLEKTYATVICALSGASIALGAVLEGKNYESAVSVGSNGFAINSKLSADGGVYLVNDPHWLIDGPITFYECHLHSDEGWNISGGVYPGIPMPANAITPDLGWNLPFNFPDLVDVYELEINPTNKKQYKFDDKWLDLEVRKIPLRVKMGFLKLKVKKKAYWTVYGPAIETKDGKIMATRFAANQHIGALNQLYQMGKSTNLTQFKEAVKEGKMPLFNIIYADKDDNLFYIYKALIPKRNPNYEWQKVLPGNTSETLWDEFLSFDELPQVTNPECGYIYNMNSSSYYSTCADESPKQGPYHKTGGIYIDPENDRSVRFRELVEGKSKITYDEFKAFKYDLDYPINSDGAFDFTLQSMQKLDEKKYPEIADALAHLRTCKLDGRMENTHTALYLMALGHLFEEVDANKRTFIMNGFPYDEKLFVDAVKHARKILLKKHGRLDVPLNEVQFLVRGNKKVAIPGLPQNLNSVEGTPTKDGLIQVYRNSSFLQFANYNGDSLNVESVHTYGNSKRPESKHYDDQMEMHANFQTKQVVFDKDFLIQNAERIYHPQ